VDAGGLIAIGTGKPLMFEPGTNWGYSHTNWVILGEVLEAVGGQPSPTRSRRTSSTRSA
jgi:CubicO group peptidase (beta-lactamase class C family)